MSEGRKPMLFSPASGIAFYISGGSRIEPPHARGLSQNIVKKVGISYATYDRIKNLSD